MFLYRLALALDKNNVEYAIVGGYAVALHGAARGTIDIDVVIKLSEKSYVSAEKALRSMGLQPRLPITAKDVFNFRNEYISKRNLIAWSFFNPRTPSEDVDVIVTHDLKKLRIKKIKLGKYQIKILDIKDLIKMKKDSGRPQDIEDVKALEKLRR